MSYLIGIDSGVNHIGIAILNIQKRYIEYHTEQTSKNHASYYENFKALLGDWNPVKVFIEKPFFTPQTIGKNTRTLETIGIQKLCCEQIPVPCIMLPPKTVKKVITGNGNAKKQQVIDAVEKLFQLKLKSTHVADACAIAYTGYLQDYHND